LLAFFSSSFTLLSHLNESFLHYDKSIGLIKQFVKDVDWGDLDHLLIDTPPGTSDEHLSIIQYLKETGITGAVIVTTPQEVALQYV